jgi:2'-5' RNA ligase
MKSRNLFIGIPIEGETAQLLEAIQFKWREILGLSKEFLILKADFHLTLHFLGAIAEERVSLWEESLEKYSKLQSFSFHLVRFLSFPNSLEPRVLTVAGPIGNSPLSHLFYQMAETVEGLGIKVEKRALIPHVTLFRGQGIKINQPVEVPNPIEVPITSFALYESLASNGASRYRILKRYLLRVA